MPHLDLTYFINQSFWCLLIFLLIYFTVDKYFVNHFNKVINKRKGIVQDYINDSKIILIKAQHINDKINDLKQSLMLKLNEEEIRFQSSILNIKNNRLYSLKKEINNSNLEHEILLNKLEQRLSDNLYSYSNKFQSSVNNFLFDQ